MTGWPTFAWRNTLTWCALCCAPLTVACSGFQSVLDPRGPRAEAVAKLHWTLTAIATLVYVVVISALVFALWRAWRRAPVLEEHQYHETPEQAGAMKRGVIIGVSATAAIMLTFVIVSVSTGSTFAK